MENKYFEYVVRQRNILIFGDESLEKFNNIFDKLNNKKKKYKNIL